MSQIELGNATSIAMGPISVVPSTSTTSEPSFDLRPFTVDEYHRLGESGVLRDGERLELLNGVITMMSPIGTNHFKATTKLQKCLMSLVPSAWEIVSSQPLGLPSSEPVPDLMVIRGPVEAYESIPRAEQVGIVIEIADTTLSRDRSLKMEIYAAAGIPEYWIVNLTDRKLEVHRRPIGPADEQPARYESIEAFGTDDAVHVVVGGTSVGTIQVRDLLP